MLWCHWYGFLKNSTCLICICRQEDTQALCVSNELPISSDVFFETFPFHVVFNQNMIISNIGSGLQAILPHIMGQAMDEMFILTRPMIEFSLDSVS